jgi:hypothetical protein
VLPWVALGRVEIDEHVVGALDVINAAMPRVEVDAPEVDDPGEAGRVRHDREVGCAAAAGEQDVHGLEPIRMGIRNALLVEEEAASTPSG